MCDTIRNNIKQLIKKNVFLFFFLQKVKKSLGSAPKNRDGRVTGSKAFFFRPHGITKLTLSRLTPWNKTSSFSFSKLFFEGMLVCYFKLLDLFTGSC